MASLGDEIEMADEAEHPEPSSPNRSEFVDSTSKLIAASVGSLLTALTMTPFDVVKTRLQTQPLPSPLFQTVDQLPKPRKISPAHRPIASTSRVKVEALPRATAASASSTCCQPTTFFGCRFDARGLSTLGADAVHVDALPKGSVASFAPVGGHSAFSLVDAAAACAYPDAKTAEAALRNDPRRFSGMVDAVLKILRYEGPGALWRGIGPATLMSMPTAAAYMVGYDKLRARLLAGSDPSNTLYRGAATLGAGAFARTIVVTAVSPLELLRTRLQSADTGFRDVLRSYRRLVDSQGVTALWRGLPATLWRDVPFSGIYWASYEMVRRGLTGGRGFGEMKHGESRSSAFTVAFVSGAVSGSIAASVTNPFDVIKSRRQASSDTNHTRTSALLRTLLREEGMKGFFSGLTPRLAKVAPACGIMISVYEAAAHWK